MHRLIFIMLAVTYSCAATTLAEDYLLRLDVRDSVELSPADGSVTVADLHLPRVEELQKAKNAKLAHRLETIAHPGSAFHTKLQMGMQTIVLRGTLDVAEDGNLEVKIDYRHITDAETTVPIGSDKSQRLLDETALSTSVAVSPGNSLLLGHFETGSQRPAKVPKRSRAWIVLTVAKYEPHALSLAIPHCECDAQHSQNSICD